MMSILRWHERRTTPSGTVRFEGRPYGGEVSFFLVDNAPGQGSALHVHPYSETWVVRTGEAAFTVGEATTHAFPGDIIVAPANVPHRFENVGPGRLELICIHPSDMILQTLV